MPNPTQDHLPIAGIQDGVIVMNDGSVRAVLKLEPINFDLKSETEQNGIIYAYQAFLNSLDFPIQIVVQSKKLDLERYLMRLGESQREVTTDLLRIQVEDYIGFVRRLISVANIMSKRFYVVISYSAVTRQAATAQVTNLFHRRPTGPLMDQEQFARFQAEAYNRAGIIAGGLARLGVKSQILDTQQLIELFYGIYNPDVATEERLTEIDILSSGVVHAPEALPQDFTQQSTDAMSEMPLPPADAEATAQYAVPQPGEEGLEDPLLPGEEVPTSDAPDATTEQPTEIPPQEGAQQ